MLRAIPLVLVLSLAAPLSFAQPTPPAKAPAYASADRLGKTCAQVLAMTSTKWQELYAKKDSSTLGIVKALSVYGDCYEKRSDALAKKLGQQGTGPLMGATGNFRDFQSLLEGFTSKALAATAGGGTIDQINAASAALYQKQFRYNFYLSYTKSPDAKAPAPAGEETPALDKARTRLIHLFLSHKGHEGADLGLAFTELKNAYLQVSLDALPLYLYAISLLQSPAEPPYSPPPF